MIDEDFVNYSKASMFIGTVYCDGKCWKEQHLPKETCQNSCMYDAEHIIRMDDDKLCKRYLNNPITHAIVFGGLEPMLQIDDLEKFLHELRCVYQCYDDVVIYTGYTEDECKRYGFFDKLNKYAPIVYKVGRYIPNSESVIDKVLGVTLASNNQYGIRVDKK